MPTDSDLTPLRQALEEHLSACEDAGVSNVYVATRNGAAGEPVVLEANRCGLLYLAAHFIALAEQQPSAHLHLDDTSVLETCEKELIISHVEPS